MNTLYLCTHYGFGDYVICYGLVKELSKKYDKIFLFGKRHQTDWDLDNIRRLYSSIKNVEVIVDDPNLYKNVTYLGWHHFIRAQAINQSTQFQQFFYEYMGIPFNLMWDNFYFERDMIKEKEIYYDKLGLKDNEEYIFLHDDNKRGFIINKQYISPNIKIINTGIIDISLLDSLYLVEKSKEIHIIPTGLVSFIDQMNIRHNHLNIHQYTRPENQIIVRLKWNKI
jgi:hypothetical protein